MRATHLLIPGHIEPDGGVKCCICGCATTKDRIGKDYFGDIFRDYPVYAMTGGGRYDRYRLRVSAIGNPEGRGVGRLKWEKEYYGDVLNRIGKTLWLREYEL